MTASTVRRSSPLALLVAAVVCGCQSPSIAQGAAADTPKPPLEPCLELQGRYSARGVEPIEGGPRIFYYEVVSLSRANSAEFIGISFDATDYRLVLRQMGADGNDVVSPSRIRGVCEGGKWVNRFAGPVSTDGGRVDVVGDFSVGLQDGRLAVSYKKREEWRSKFREHDRRGLFERRD